MGNEFTGKFEVFGIPITKSRNNEFQLIYLECLLSPDIAKDIVDYIDDKIDLRLTFTDEDTKKKTVLEGAFKVEVPKIRSLKEGHKQRIVLKSELNKEAHKVLTDMLYHVVDVEWVRVDKEIPGLEDFRDIDENEDEDE